MADALCMAADEIRPARKQSTARMQGSCTLALVKPHPSVEMPEVPERAA